MTCNCRSYNRPEWGGDEPEAGVYHHAKGLVYVDPCIAPLIKALWRAGIETMASCCGHNAIPPSICIEDPRQVPLACWLLASIDPRDIQVIVYAKLGRNLY